jgi:hypothetical protein
MQNPSYPSAEIGALEAAAVQSVQSGREADAVRHWSRILELDPNHLRALNALGQRAFRQRDLPAARAAFQRIVDNDGKIPQQWIQLAIACRDLGDEIAEEHAIQSALNIDPRDLVGLILRGNLLERSGRMHEAGRAYAAVTAVAATTPQVPAELRAAVAEAAAYSGKYSLEKGRFLDAYLDQHYRDFAGENLSRFRTSVDILAGRKKRYDSQSLIYHFPRLAPIEFFPREEFPWIESLEAATDDIRDEFLDVLRTRRDSRRTSIAGLPLNGSRSSTILRDGARSTCSDGQRVDANAAGARDRSLQGIPQRRNRPAGRPRQFLAAEAQDDDSPAHGRDQRAPRDPPRVDHPRRLHVPRRQ